MKDIRIPTNFETVENVINKERLIELIEDLPDDSRFNVAISNNSLVSVIRPKQQLVVHSEIEEANDHYSVVIDNIN